VLSKYRQYATIIRRFQMHIISIPHQFIRYVYHGVIMRAVTNDEDNLLVAQTQRQYYLFIYL